MMASIPNMRSTPLPVPASTTAPPGDPASVGFTVQLPVVPVAEQLPATPDLPAVAAAPVQLPTLAELFDGTAPNIVAPEGGDDGADGEGNEAQPAKAETPKEDDEAQPAIVLPFVQQAAPVTQILPKTARTETPPVAAAATGAVPVALPRGTAPGRKDIPAADVPDAPKAEAADSQDIESAVKALLQRKPLPAKQAAAAPKAEAADPAKTDFAAAEAAPRQAPAEPLQTQASALPAPAAVQAAAPIPVADAPQPALSPTAQPALAAADKTATVDGTRHGDLAVERKLDLSRDSAWLDRLAHDIARAASDDAPLRFRLHPQTLGSLHVELQQGDRGTAVRLTVETETARQILTDAQPRLTAEARAQGVRIAETHVDLSGSGRHAPGDQRRQDEARQTPFIRTAPGPDAATAARSARRARLDRYA